MHPVGGHLHHVPQVHQANLTVWPSPCSLFAAEVGSGPGWSVLTHRCGICPTLRLLMLFCLYLVVQKVIRRIDLCSWAQVGLAGVVCLRTDAILKRRCMNLSAFYNSTRQLAHNSIVYFAIRFHYCVLKRSIPTTMHSTDFKAYHIVP